MEGKDWVDFKEVKAAVGLSTDLLYRFAYPDVRKSYCTIEPSTISMLAPWGTFLNFKDGVPQKSEDTEETEVTVG